MSITHNIAYITINSTTALPQDHLFMQHKKNLKLELRVSSLINTLYKTENSKRERERERDKCELNKLKKEV